MRDTELEKWQPWLPLRVSVLRLYNPHKHWGSNPGKWQMPDQILRKNEMTDKRVHGIGHMDVPGATNRKGPHYGAYQCWNKMLKFSYSDKPAKATMCEEWHTFSNFLGWYVDNVPQGKGASVHRKPGCLHYSPETATVRIPKKRITLKDIAIVVDGVSVSMETLLQQMRQNLAA